MYINNASHIKGQVMSVSVFSAKTDEQRYYDGGEQSSETYLRSGVLAMADGNATTYVARHTAVILESLVNYSGDLFGLELILDDEHFRTCGLQVEVEFGITETGYGITDYLSNKVLLRNGVRGEVI
jgi:hypothetical protein